jgi:RNA polymerase sigma factor (TIGR02999 family)
MSSRETSSELLRRSCDGDRAAEAQLSLRVYADLRERAHAMMRRQPAGHSLQTTMLVHEAWLKLAANSRDPGLSRTHFVRLAATAMRSILVDHARAKATVKRGAGLRVELGDADICGSEPNETLLALNDALDRLDEFDEQLARVAEMRLFGGLEHSDIAKVIQTSTRTAERAWKLARAWLARELEPDDK